MKSLHFLLASVVLLSPLTVKGQTPNTTPASPASTNHLAQLEQTLQNIENGIAAAA
jgi:hypothetical protein